MTKPIPPPNAPSGIALYVVDAFASEPFRGNPAAVCLLDQPAETDWMQRVAGEMNLSETAFVSPRTDGWDLRWFTPSIEVDLCGHATLASAHALWELQRLPPDAPARFLTRVSGELVCRRESSWIVMDFPARPAKAIPAPPGLAEALGIEPVWVGRSVDDYLVEVADATTVRGLRPDQARLATLCVRGVIVTAGAAREGQGFDFLSRFFAPGAGVAEDPVTGSAHCTLGPFWADRLGRTDLRAWQASARGGEVRVRVLGERIELRGEAVTVWRGTLFA